MFKSDFILEKIMVDSKGNLDYFDKSESSCLIFTMMVYEKFYFES